MGMPSLDHDTLNSPLSSKRRNKILTIDPFTMTTRRNFNLLLLSQLHCLFYVVVLIALVLIVPTSTCWGFYHPRHYHHHGAVHHSREGRQQQQQQQGVSSYRTHPIVLLAAAKTTMTTTGGGGGGKYGGKGFAKSKQEEEGLMKTTTTTTTTETPIIYPPLTNNEIETWMNHIPVYAVTDGNGNGKSLQLSYNSTKSIFYFFMSSTMAEAHLNQLKEVTEFSKLFETSNDDDDDDEDNNDKNNELDISGLFLGKIWFSILNNLKNNVDQDVEYRLVPDPRDLITARSLLEEDVEDNDGINDDDIEEEEGMDSPSVVDNNGSKPQCQFEKIYNEIPIFALNSLPPPQSTATTSSKTKKKKDNIAMQQREQQKMMINQLVSSHYMCFSSDNLLQLLMDAETNDENVELHNELLSLSEVIEKMQQPSIIDYRNVVLVPSTPVEDVDDDNQEEEAAGTAVSDAYLRQQLADRESFVCDTFFTPLFVEEE